MVIRTNGYTNKLLLKNVKNFEGAVLVRAFAIRLTNFGRPLKYRKPMNPSLQKSTFPVDYIYPTRNSHNAHYVWHKNSHAQTTPEHHNLCNKVISCQILLAKKVASVSQKPSAL